jgi:hypothetical protein
MHPRPNEITAVQAGFLPTRNTSLNDCTSLANAFDSPATVTSFRGLLLSLSPITNDDPALFGQDFLHLLDRD